jgi:hypothetical protein
MRELHISEELRNKIVIAQRKMDEIHSHPLRYCYLLEEIVKALDVKEYNNFVDPKYLNIEVPRNFCDEEYIDDISITAL